MKHFNSRSPLACLLVAGVLAASTGCISVRRDVEPATTTTTTVTRPSTIVPAVTTTVERTTY